jgi:hypothetical protein
MPIIDSSYYRKRISFEVYPATIIGTKFENVEVLCIVDYETAMNFADVHAKHIAVYPQLPTTPVPVPVDPSAYDYLKVRLQNGQIEYVGLPWIRPETVQELSSAQWVYTFPNLGLVEKQRLDQFLAAARIHASSQKLG